MENLKYKDFKRVVKILPELNNFLPKDNIVILEDGTASRYENLKEQIITRGILKPVSILDFEDKYYLIDGFTRWQIVDEDLKVDPDYLIPYTVVNIKDLTKDNFLPAVKDWMWDLNQSMRGYINNPKLITLMMGIKYNLLIANPQFEGWDRPNRAKEIAEEFSKSKASVERAGKLIRDLETLGSLYDRPNNSFYYLYEEGVSQAKIAKLAGIEKGSKNYRKLEKYILTKDSKAISLFITEKELKQARLEKEEKDRKHRLSKAKGVNHLSNICKLYSEESLTWSHLEQIKRLERCLTKQEEKEWFFSGLKQVNNKENLTKLIIQTKQQFPLLQNNKVRTSPNFRSIKPQTSFVEREVIQQPYILIEEEEELDTFDISAFDPTDKELAEKTVRTLTDLYYDLSSNPITEGLEENLNTLITLINNRLEEH